MRAAAGSSCRQDQENAARTSAAGSPSSANASRLGLPARSAATCARGRSGRMAARAAITHNASGRRAHKRMICAAAPVSAASRAAPRRCCSNSCASVVGQHVQHQRPGSLDRRQAGELTAAGDHDPAGRRAGQQRPHLRHVTRIVQHDEHPLAGQQAAVQAQLRLFRLGQPVSRDLQRVQQHADGVGRRASGAGRVEAAQVHVELPVGELARRPDAPTARQARSSRPPRCRRWPRSPPSRPG